MVHDKMITDKKRALQYGREGMKGKRMKLSRIMKQVKGTPQKQM